MNTVATEKRAVEILTEKGATSTENKSCRCACGQTQCVYGYDEEYLMIGKVGVCDSCGDDDAFVDEVFYKK